MTEEVKQTTSIQQSAAEIETVNKGSNEEISASASQSGVGEEGEGESPELINNHDLIGVEGIIRAQKNEIEKKKVRLKRFVNVR